MKKFAMVAALMGVCMMCMPASDVFAAPAKVPAVGLLPQQVGQMASPARVGKPGAVILSLAMPGAGEWLNRDFAGSFPLVECIGGYICCFIQLSSSLDAAAGDRSEKIRLDFWSKPIPEQ